MSEHKEIENSTGNVFADLDLPNPEQMLAKAKIAVKICKVINDRNLSPSEASIILGISETEILNIMRGQFDDFTPNRLEALLNIIKPEKLINHSLKSVFM